MQSVDDYLTKQLFIHKNVVTFRSLSRQCNIHVNEAKKALQAYHSTPQSSTERYYATYLLSGEADPRRSLNKRGDSAQEEHGMNVDNEDESKPPHDDGAEVVPQTLMTLVGEEGLENTKSNFIRIRSQHVYCLSPTPLVDPSLIRAPSAQVYAVDCSLPADKAVLLGRITGPHVTIGKQTRPPVVPAKGKEPISRTPTREKVEEDKGKSSEFEPTVKIEPKEALAPAPKAKPSGKLDWSKAKVKGKEKSKSIRNTDEEKGSKTKKGPPAKVAAGKLKETFFNSGRSSSKTDASDTPPPQVKQGTKRKSVHESSDSDNMDPPPSSSSPAPQPEPALVRPGRRVKRGVVYSDEEEDTTDTTSSRPVKGKAKVTAKSIRREIEAEKSLKAMMDIDDDQVIKASRPQKVMEEESTENDDVSMEDEAEPEPEPEPEVKPKPRKKREKKVIPLGQNGLKKKRLVKSRMKLDEKGYMVTEDYSEYESVDEEELEDPKPRRGKKAVTKDKKVDAASKEENSPAAGGSETKSSKPKPLEKSNSRKSRSSGPVKRSNSTKSSTTRNGSLMSFFEKK